MAECDAEGITFGVREYGRFLSQDLHLLAV
jgi:hypothetical protein